MFGQQIDGYRSKVDLGDGIRADPLNVQFLIGAYYIEVFDANLDRIAGFEVRSIGPMYIRVIRLAFLRFGHESLGLNDQPLNIFSDVGYI